MDDLVAVRGSAAVSLSGCVVGYVDYADTDGRKRRDILRGGLVEAASVAWPTAFHRLWPGRLAAGPTLPLSESSPVCAG